MRQTRMLSKGRENRSAEADSFAVEGWFEMTGEEWKVKGKLLQELNALRDRVAQLEHAGKDKKREQPSEPGGVLGAMLDDIAEGVLLIDAERKQAVGGNKAICRMLSCKRRGITDLRVKDVYPPEALGHVLERAHKQIMKKPSLAQDVPIKRNDGGILFADISSVPLTFAGKTYIMSVFVRRKAKLPPSPKPTGDSQASPHLTTMEINVLKLIVKGMSNKQIAQLLLRSQRTIENHRAHLMKKLGAENSVELVRRAVALGLADLPAAPKQRHTG
ncbi:MAG: response regulator transcription factor [Sedimentisphaerales bacterium]|jgi:DNA-binding CsgD family transcriptional regulator